MTKLIVNLYTFAYYRRLNAEVIVESMC